MCFEGDSDMDKHQLTQNIKNFLLGERKMDLVGVCPAEAKGQTGAEGKDKAKAKVCAGASSRSEAGQAFEAQGRA